MSELSELFLRLDEPYAAGFFLHEEASLFRRYCEALGTFLARSELPGYAGKALYPSGSFGFRGRYAARPEYSFTFSLDVGAMKGKCPEEALGRLTSEMRMYPLPPTPHAVGGYTYTHSMPNYERIAREGLDSYRHRVEAMEDGDFRAGLLALLDGIARMHARSLEKLTAEHAEPRLIEALRQVPFKPARDLYEAVVCRNFVYYLDGCDNPGRLDTELFPYYRGEDITEIFEEFFDNVDSCNGWSSALGPDHDPLTIQILHAIRGRRRPSLELRVTPDMPDEVWQAALEAIQCGGGSPALYNEERYQRSLAETFPEIPAEDRLRFNGGGCTETMLAGISHVGSLDAGINTALVFSDVLRGAPDGTESFEAFYEILIGTLREVVDDTLGKVETACRDRAKILPQPMRTLLVDDCLDRGLDFNAGGARWNWSVINFAGLINVIDSLLAVRELVFETKEYTLSGLIEALDGEDGRLYTRLKSCPCFGVDDEEADALAARFVGDAFALLENRTPYLGGKYLPASIQFVTYIDAGRNVPATPDGRRAGDPLCDCVGAIHAKDTEGPTALLNSVASMDLSKALGTPVLNLKMRPEHVEGTLRQLAESFFRLGGMHIQVTCVSRADLEDALIHPEAHGNLIVRVGGYAEYFNRLPEDLKRSVIERTEY